MKKIKDIWLYIRRWLRPKAPPRPDFVKWCETSPPKHATRSFSLKDFSAGAQPNVEQLTAFLEEIVNELNNSNDDSRAIDVVINRNLAHPSSLVARFSSPKKTIRNFSIISEITQPLKLDSLYILNLAIQGSHKQQIIIENSFIAAFQIHHPKHLLDLDIRNTYIGKLLLSEGCLKCWNMYGGGITRLEIEPPGSDNPFTGSVWFKDTWFPTDKNMAQKSQPYRNMSHHLRELKNVPMADLFHALELKTERHEETWTNKILSHLYEKFSDFGASILRPVLWLLLLGILVAYTLIIWDGAVPTHTLELSAVGWQTALLGDGMAASIARGFYLSFYSIIHPLGLFGGQPVLVARTPWLSSLLIVEGIFAATLIALTIFALRRRFKLQQS